MPTSRTDTDVPDAPPLSAPPAPELTDLDLDGVAATRPDAAIADLDHPPPAAAAAGADAGGHGPAAHGGTALLVLGALGVVFGDVGTSVLYSLHTVFSEHGAAIKVNELSVYGVISMVFWTITAVVTVKYVTFIMRADNDGEGGIMALIALIKRISTGGKFVPRAALITLGVFGASLFFGDAMITPAISVLSAVEGVNVVTGSVEHLVVPIAVTIIVALFTVQRFGTALVGRLFGPVMVAWFGVLAVGGVAKIVTHPDIIAALLPSYAVEFAVRHPDLFFIALSGVVLTITGVEALYADMGHFSAGAIRRAWLLVVFPALTLNYMGQGVAILQDPSAIANPFFLLFPEWSRLPMIVLATLATVIASQAVISGAFSVSRQAMQLGFLPRLTVRHTGRDQGQVYVPAVNWGILAAVLALIVAFESSQNLAAAYGIAVTGTLAIDTVLFFTVVRARWRKPLPLVLFAAAVTLTIDLLFFSANLSKLLAGGWFPVLIALVAFTAFMTWNRGRELVTARRTEEEGPLRDFIDDVHELTEPAIFRVPGTAIFLNANPQTTPLALRASVEHQHSLHAAVVIVSVHIQPVPNVPASERITVDDLGYTDDGIFHVAVRYGFQDDVDIPAAIALATTEGLECQVDLDEASYFVSRVVLRRGPGGGMARWRKVLFLAMARHAANPVEYFNLPIDRTVVMGGHITV
jgi:KUP system potassium uptake protein